MNKKCIVSFAANGREQYTKAILRLIKSCVNAGWNGDYLMRTFDGYVDRYEGVNIINGSYPINEKHGLCPNNEEIPYGFKPAIIQEALEKGYKQIVWCDSTITMYKNIQPLLEYAAINGICAFHNLGHDLNGWLTDLQQERLGFTNAELIAGIKQIMACCIIFDFTHKVCIDVFDKWIEASKDGVSFQNGYGSQRPGFVSSRHDQSYLSGLLHIAGVKLQPYGKLVYRPHDTTFEYGNDFFFINKAVD